MSDENIYENEKYYVRRTPDALGEDGKYGRFGYAVINKETEVIEHTTTVLPQALFQADAFQGALGSLRSQGGNGQNDEAIDVDSADILVLDTDSEPTVQ